MARCRQTGLGHLRRHSKETLHVQAVAKFLEARRKESDGKTSEVDDATDGLRL